jgi:hypothetical protein
MLLGSLSTLPARDVMAGLNAEQRTAVATLHMGPASDVFQTLRLGETRRRLDRLSSERADWAAVGVGE